MQECMYAVCVMSQGVPPGGGFDSQGFLTHKWGGANPMQMQNLCEAFSLTDI